MSYLNQFSFTGLLHKSNINFQYYFNIIFMPKNKAKWFDWLVFLSFSVLLILNLMYQDYIYKHFINHILLYQGGGILVGMCIYAHLRKVFNVPSLLMFSAFMSSLIILVSNALPAILILQIMYTYIGIYALFLAYPIFILYLIDYIKNSPK
jgi:hypothetical protein